MWNINAPARAYPLHDFHEICRVCTPFQDALAVKISLDLLKGLWSYGGFKFSVPPISETMRQIPKSFRGARTCSRSSITTPSLVGLGFHLPLSFLSVCLFVMLLNIRVRATQFRWRTEMILMLFDSGRFVVVHPCSTFSDCHQLATPLNGEVQKTAKIGVFCRQRVTE